MHCIIVDYVSISTDCDVQLHATQKLLEELGAMVILHKNEVKPYLNHINSFLTNAILKCKAAIVEIPTKPTTTSKPFSNKEDIAPGKKPEHQWRFQKTAKTPGRKKSECTLRYGEVNTMHSHRIHRKTTYVAHKCTHSKL